MDNYRERKERGSANHGSRGVWGHNRSSANRRIPLAGQRRDSIPSWEKKFCESICLIPWHKLLEAKKFTHLYENVIRWNDTAAEEAFKDAKSRFWAEMNGLPCNIKLPDPDTYIDKVDWNSNVDPELLLDLERGPDMDSKAVGAEGDIVIRGKPLILDSEPFLCDEGWGNLDEVPVPPAGSKGWNNWDDDKCNWEGSGYKNGFVEDSYGNGNMANGISDPCAGNSYGGRGGEWNDGNGWDHGHYPPGKNTAFDRIGRNQAPPNNQWRRKEADGYGQNRGFKSSRGRQRQERPRWADGNPSYGRW